jgi:hypothetical protein
MRDQGNCLRTLIRNHGPDAQQNSVSVTCCMLADNVIICKLLQAQITKPSGISAPILTQYDFPARVWLHGEFNYDEHSPRALVTSLTV